MRRITLAAAAAGLAAAALAGPCGTVAAQVRGAAPTYTERGLSKVPNGRAMTALIWAPGLDDGFVPQGLTVVDGSIFVAAYRSSDPKQDRGPCRIYRLDARSGDVTGTLDLPPSCGHAGGLARGRPGQLWVADTRVIFEVALEPAGDAGIGRVVRSIRLEGALRGSFAASAADALWLGTYSKEPGAKLYKLPFEGLAPGPAAVSVGDAAASVVLPAKAQGAAFDAGGRLWVTLSGSAFGELVQLDPGSGAVLRRLGMPAGIEDISFAQDGGLWGVGEAGSRRWLGWTTFFPVVFRLRPDRLR
jgi:sugar lactone lactonase YvrE